MNLDPAAPEVKIIAQCEGRPPVSPGAAGSPICGIYGIWCEANEKWYVGRSVRIGHRWWSHQHDLEKGTHSNPYLQCAWDKYGAASFLWVVLCRCEQDELGSLESRYAEDLHAIAPYGFSFMAGEGHALVSQETRSKMSARSSGSKNPMYGKRGSLAPMFGKRGRDNPNFGKKWDLSPEQKARRLAGIIGTNNGMSGKFGPDNPLYGRKRPEHSKFMRGPGNPNTGKKRPDVSKRLSGKGNPMYGLKGEKSPNYGLVRSPETRARISAARKLFYQKKKANLTA